MGMGTNPRALVRQANGAQWWVLLTLLATFLALIASVLQAWQYPIAGIFVQPRQGQWVVTWVDPTWPEFEAGIRPHDILIALDETPIEATGISENLAGVLGRARWWTVERAGTIMTIDRASFSHPWFDLIEPNTLLLLALCFWALAGIVWFSKPNDTLVSEFAWFHVTVALCLGLADAGGSGPVWARVLSVLSFAALPALSLRFFIRFTRTSELRGWRVIALHGFSAVCVALGLTHLGIGLVMGDWDSPLRVSLLILLAIS